MTDAISPVAPTAAQVQQTASASASSKDYNMFLRLLTTQMKNQDPTAPVDATEFVSQIATFTQVEQLTQINSGVSELSKLFTGSLARLDLGYVGMEVEAKVDVFKFDGNPVDFRYVTNGAETVEISVVDVTGNKIRTVDGDATSGEQKFVWDGLNDDGSIAPQGQYRLEVVAKDAAGKQLDAVTSMRGLVEEVVTEAGVSILVYTNGTAVDSSMVVGARKPMVTASA